MQEQGNSSGYEAVSMKCHLCRKSGSESKVLGLKFVVCKDHHEEVTKRIVAITSFCDDLKVCMLKRAIKGYLKDGRPFSVLKRNSRRERNDELVDFMVYTSYGRMLISRSMRRMEKRCPE